MLLAFIATAVGCFGLGMLTAILCLSAKQDDLLYDEAERVWGRMCDN